MSTTRKDQVRKSGQQQQSIKSFLSSSSSSSTNSSNSGNNIAVTNKKPVATVRPVSITHHDKMDPAIDLTKSPIINRSNKYSFNR